ncbi:MAG: hypothetical protein IJ146_00640 [Kiritimatiellae bacterium]|nr:hypothetical protein [Kiritimatiellia bacterium]
MPGFVFVNTHNKTTRPTYRIRNGAPAIRFEGSSSGSMTNGVPTPDSLTGNNPWTVEAWVAPTKSVTDIRYFLSLSTYKNLSDNALTRAGASFTATREIDLVEAMDSNSAWIGFTGATGGSSARQLVYDFNFAYDEVDLTSRYSNPFVVNGAVQMNLGMGSVGFTNLTLADGAAITASSQYETELELAGTKLLGSAAVTAAEGVPIVLDGTITFAPDTGVLKLTGDVRSNGKVKLELSSLKSIRSLIDLSSATTTLTADDFEIVGDVPPPVRIAIQNGMLRAWRNVSTVLFFR